MNNKYEAVIGLEVHAQMLTESKAFCSCSTKFGNDPNSNVCPVCLGMPGVLPVLNKKLVEFVILMGLATNCQIQKKCTFARKNYFYPDLPKGYQISQFDEPICTKGYIEIENEDGTTKKIGLTRIHMEEDAGKSIHDIAEDTLVDINRCGVPLIEIVSEPDIRSPKEAYLYLTQIKQIVTYLGICDGNMEEGSLRCDANVSVRLKGEKKFGTKTELKNMNSFRNVEKALHYEISRQIETLERGEPIVQETLLWDANKEIALPMRSKEEAHDYRYFPEPDLVPLYISDEWINDLQKEIPELGTEKKKRFILEYGLPDYDADVLTVERGIAEYFEETCKSFRIKSKDAYKQASNWIMVDILRVLKENKVSINQFKLRPNNLAMLIDLINDNTISGKIAKDVFEVIKDTNENPKSYIESKGLVQISDSNFIEECINKILNSNSEQVNKYLSGKEQVFGFFVGQVMKEMKGKANPQIVNELLKTKLNELKNQNIKGEQNA
ncbi:MAG TPA: Asp-tRNA(Asn)/Glu-tRNA(Gln) amidotransferase subunit GatB [Ignavibacteria bacterium]